jgi:hypothetical protein
VEDGVELFNIPRKDLADLADITPDEAERIIAKLAEKAWLVEDVTRSVLRLKNTSQLAHLAGRG